MPEPLSGAYVAVPPVVVDKIGRVWQQDDKTLWEDQAEPYWRCYAAGGRGMFAADLFREWGPLVRLVPEAPESASDDSPASGGAS